MKFPLGLKHSNLKLHVSDAPPLFIEAASFDQMKHLNNKCAIYVCSHFNHVEETTFLFFFVRV